MIDNSKIKNFLQKLEYEKFFYLLFLSLIINKSY